jgi:hypothetical protein
MTSIIASRTHHRLLALAATIALLVFPVQHTSASNVGACVGTFYATSHYNVPLTSSDASKTVFFGSTVNFSPTLGNFSTATWSSGNVTMGNFADVSFQSVRIDATHWDYFLTVVPTGSSHLTAVYATVTGRDAIGRVITTTFPVPLAANLLAGPSVHFGPLGPVDTNYAGYPYSSLDPSVWNTFATNSLLPVSQAFVATIDNSSLVDVADPLQSAAIRADVETVLISGISKLIGTTALHFLSPVGWADLAIDIGKFGTVYIPLNSAATTAETAFENAYAAGNQLAQKSFYPTSIVLTAVSDDVDPSILKIGGFGQAYTNSFTEISPTETTGVSSFYSYQGGPLIALGPIDTIETLDSSGNVIYGDSTITMNSNLFIRRQAYVLSPFVSQPDGSLLSSLDEFDFSPTSPPQQGATYGCLSGSNPLSAFTTSGNVTVTNVAGTTAILLTKSSPSSAATAAQVPGQPSLLFFQYAWPNAFDTTEIATFTIDFTSVGQTTPLFQSSASDPTVHSSTLFPITLSIPAALQGQSGVLRFLLTPDTNDPVKSQVMFADFAIVPAPVVDTTPPAITVAASPKMLWPPNKKLIMVTVTGTITDNEISGTGVNPSTAKFSVTDEYGQVQPNGSLTLNPDGRYNFMIQLPASRDGGDRDGRHYTIRVSAQDNAGNKGSAVTVVTVPHDQGNHM